MPRTSFERCRADIGSALNQGAENGQIRPKKEKVILYLFKTVSGYSSKFIEFVVIQEASENCYGVITRLSNSFRLRS